MYCGSFDASNTCTGNASTRLASISVPPRMRKVPVGAHISADLHPMYPLECVICTLDVQSQAPLECGAQQGSRMYRGYFAAYNTRTTRVPTLGGQFERAICDAGTVSQAIYHLGALV